MGGRGASSSTAVARTGGDPGTLPKSGETAFKPLNEAPGGYAVTTRFEREGHSLEVYGTVKTTAGKFAGEFGATFHREGGKLIAKTDNLLMAEGHQGRGVGAAIARNLDRTYARLGVSEVRLHATQVGRYTWAKAGYDWSPSTGREMQASYGRWLSARGHDPAGAAVAQRGAKALAESTHGKAFLLSDDAPNWHGSKKL